MSAYWTAMTFSDAISFYETFKIDCIVFGPTTFLSVAGTPCNRSSSYASD